MREILFRGKEKKHGVWVYGYLEKRPSPIQFGDYSPWYIFEPPCDPDDVAKWWNVDPKTVGQFTGLLDKNGTKIFEGDIWKRGDVCGVVRWDDEEARFIVSYEIGGIEYQNAVCERKLKTIEIIGNIHDNPDLLKGDAE